MSQIAEWLHANYENSERPDLLDEDAERLAGLLVEWGWVPPKEAKAAHYALSKGDPLTARHVLEDVLNP